MESQPLLPVGSHARMDELDWRQLYMKIGRQDI